MDILMQIIKRVNGFRLIKWGKCVCRGNIEIPTRSRAYFIRLENVSKATYNSHSIALNNELLNETGGLGSSLRQMFSVWLWSFSLSEFDSIIIFDSKHFQASDCWTAIVARVSMPCRLSVVSPCWLPVVSIRVISSPSCNVQITRVSVVETLPRPTRSYNPNPIEHLWDYLGCQI